MVVFCSAASDSSSVQIFVISFSLFWSDISDLPNSNVVSAGILTVAISSELTATVGLHIPFSSVNSPLHVHLFPVCVAFASHSQVSALYAPVNWHMHTLFLLLYLYMHRCPL